jgi:hypothetical protein
MTIATQADVEAHILRPLTAQELTYLPKLLAAADARIGDALPYIKWDGVSNNANVTMKGSGVFEIWLPGRPVINVDSVTVDGVLWDPLQYDWSEWGDVAIDRGEWDRRSTITIVWDYGYAAPPVDIVNVAADLVKWGIVNPTGLRQEAIQSYSATYATELIAAADLAPYLPVLNRYRYPVVV